MWRLLQIGLGATWVIQRRRFEDCWCKVIYRLDGCRYATQPWTSCVSALKEYGPSHRGGAPCGLRGCKNGPAPFPGRMSYKATKPGLVCLLYLSMLYNIVLLFIRAPFYVLLVFVAVCSVFWLFWLSCQYLPSDWLKRPLWGSLTVASWSSP